jgi:5-methylcytosine-specific restriction endonuclease McrA
MKRESIKHKPKRQSKEGQQAMKQFKARWKGKPCWACTATGQERHHIVYRDGVAAADDERNLAWLCKGCHNAHHQRGLKNFFGRRIEELTTGQIMHLKKIKDPEFYDPEFLDRLAHPDRTLREFFKVKEPQ